MGIDKALLTGSTGMLVLRLLETGDLYGYQMIEELRRRSDSTFELKAGTLYPLLHSLEQKGFLESYEQAEQQPRPRRYYHLTQSGRRQLAERQAEWRAFVGAVDRVLEGGACLA